ncbi:hypothetical protein [Escherichia coli]|uniref:hypothetical protein n=1 Tax=Escherichia coli TaxID=562 RepID=UPI0013CF3CC1|nr:hypothetical protein [Escherichia coli]
MDNIPASGFLEPGTGHVIAEIAGGANASLQPMMLECECASGEQFMAVPPKIKCITSWFASG